MTEVPADRGPVLSGLTLADGVVDAHLADAGPDPAVDLVVDGRAVAAARLTPDPAGGWRVAARLPRDCVREGTVAVVFADRATGAQLGVYVLRAGAGVEGDLAAEVAMLRAELDALKRAFLAEAWQEKLRSTERPVIVAEVLEAVERYLEARDTDSHE